MLAGEIDGEERYKARLLWIGWKREVICEVID